VIAAAWYLFGVRDIDGAYPAHLHSARDDEDGRRFIVAKGIEELTKGDFTWLLVIHIDELLQVRSLEVKL
jgi:hypothetical protein